MGTITSGIGLISGINTGQIIDQLMKLEARPKDLLQSRIDSTTQQKLAFTDLVARLSSMQITGQTLEKPSNFQAASTTSSNPDVLTASAANGAAIGTYSLQVARLTTTQQSVSNGFTDFNQTHVGAGTITVEQGGGELSSQTTLAELNGGAGIHRGQFRITDRSGATSVIDASAAVTVDDVLKKINTSLDVSVRATLNGDKIVLTDTSGKTTSNLIVQDLGSGAAAADLGIAGSVAANTLTGTDVNYVSRNTLLSALNDGRGVRRGASGNDFTVTLQNGSTVGVNLSAAKSVGDVIDAINTAGGSSLQADIVPGKNSIRLTDNTGGGGALSIAQNGASQAARDLGLLSGANGSVINGDDIVAAINTSLISSLRGGSGLSLGQITFTDRAGASATVDFDGAQNVQGILDRINAAGIGLSASLKDSGNGIQITDTSGGSGNIVIAEAGGGQTATQLGILGSFGTSTTAVAGANLQKQWVTQGKLLSTMNGGKGVGKGKFSIANAIGQTATVNLSSPNIQTMGDVIYQINNAGVAGVTASINANGDGLLITDASGGAGKLKITDVDSTAAADLNIKGTATGTTIDGSFEKTITVGINDTLATVQTAINNLGFGVTASVINDGSPTAPFRLSLTAKNSGRAGRVVFDGGATKLGSNKLVDAQDAAVFLGGTDAAQPLLVTASTNQLTGVIPGVTINLNGVSSGPVNLSVTRNADDVVKKLSDFTTGFNDLVDKMTELTKFDTETNTPGLLLGDSTVTSIQTGVYTMLNAVVATGGKYRVLADIGVTLGEKARLQFDEEKFRAAFASDPAAVQQLFAATQSISNPDGTTTTKQLGVAYSIDNQMKALIDPVNGIVTQENHALDTRTQQFQDRITQLDVLLTNKRGRLERQFANMESILSGLQSQQAALSSFTNLLSSSSSSSKK